MSSNATRWALSRRMTGPLPAESRLVLVALAEYAGPDGRHAFPSVATLADDLGVSERTVRRQLAYLADLDLIRRGDQRHVEHYPANRRPVVYDLDLEGGRGVMVAQPVGPDGTLVDVDMPRGDTPDTPPPPARGDTHDTPGELRGVSHGQPGVSQMTPKPRTKPTTTPLPPVDPQLAHARAQAGYTPDGVHRVCGTDHPIGLSCPELRPMPADFRATITAELESAWDRCPACGGPALGRVCRRCADAGAAPLTLDDMEPAG